MDKISIVTRAYNRLEYTIRTIHSVKKYTNYENYEHIIVDNASTDGTAEWLKWIKTGDHPYFDKVRSVRSSTNLGDWKGMRFSINHLAPDSKYIVQLDNDIEVEDNWLTSMKAVIDNTDINLVMCKRKNVGCVIKPTRRIKVPFEGGELDVGYIRRPVACFMTLTDKFKQLAPKIPIHQNKTILGKRAGPCAKIMNVFCRHSDGYHEGKLIYAREKTWTSL